MYVIYGPYVPAVILLVAAIMVWQRDLASTRQFWIVMGTAGAIALGWGAKAYHLSLWVCLAGGLFGAAMSAVAWLLLGRHFWMPNLSRLGARRMTADDNGWAMGLMFVPPVVGLMFVVSTFVSLIMVQYAWGFAHSGLVLLGLNVAPSLVQIFLCAKAFRRSGYWEYPGFEIALVLIGIAWGSILNAIVLNGAGS